METLDIILLVCFVPAIITGISKGFVAQLISLASLLAGIWAAFHFSKPFAGWLGSFIEVAPEILNILAFTLCVILTVLLLTLLGKAITKVLQMAALGWANHLLGFVFAIFKTALVLSVLIFIFEPLNTQFELVKPEVIEASKIYPLLNGFATKVFPFLKDLLANV